jgi:hypothetical protein
VVDLAGPPADQLATGSTDGGREQPAGLGPGEQRQVAIHRHQGIGAD